MDDMKDRSIHFTAQNLSEDIQNMTSYKNFYTDLQKLVSSPSVKKSDFRNTLMDALKQSGMETELRNSIFHWIRAHSNHFHNQHSKEPLAYLRRAQMQWEKRIHKSLNSMSNELGVPLSRFRLASDKDELKDKWTELSTYDVDLSQYRPVYAPKDFLDVLLAIRSPNYHLVKNINTWDFTQIPLKVKTLSELRTLYSELSRGEPFLGMEPSVIASSSSLVNLEAERMDLGLKGRIWLLANKHAPTAQEFLKKGCPRSLRGRIWSQVLGCEPKTQHAEFFSELKSLVLQYDLMVDKLIIKDVQLTASNDDQYFVFEDVLYQVMLCFSRDTDVLSVVYHSASNPIHAVIRGKPVAIENTVAYPPSGIIPFHGFTMYATALCYIYDDPVNLYHTFRAFYLRYWFRLHEVSSHEQSILPLCLLFERLLQKQEPQLWLHFKVINVQPVRIVFKWIMRAFSGHLPPEQLLYLWDLILAYDSLEVLPFLALAIVSFRKHNLLKVDTLQTIEAPPNIVTHGQREAAESVFLNFKKTNSPYILCKFILETSKVDYVLFEVAGLLKDAVIREWSFLEEAWIASLQQYLLQYVIERSGTLPVFVREKILQVISVMVKRGSINDKGAHRGLLLNEIENLILNGDHSRRLLGCGLIASLIQEYGLTEKSSDIGLTWEKHCDPKEQFEVTDLKRIFQFCCRALNGLVSSDQPIPEESLSLVKQLLAISESILTWNFTAHLNFHGKCVTFLASISESNSYPPLRLCSVWKDAILEAEVVNLFFTVYWKIRSNPQLSHHALTCLVQLASLRGTIFSNEDSQAKYLVKYVEGFVKLIRSIEILDREALGISVIVEKILLFFSPFRSRNLPSGLLQSFMEQLTMLTCNFAEGAATEETMCADDRLYMEAFDHMIKGWLSILHGPAGFWKEYCVGALVQIFDVYLKCHLAPPEGTRGEGRDLEQEELDESEETDRVKFKDQLQTIGEFGRHCLEHCLPLLARLLETRTKQLSSHFNRLHHQQQASISDSCSLVLLFEDLHWLLLIAGNVISIAAEGETPFIPRELVKYSIHKSPSTSIEVSLQVFGSPNRNLDEIQDGEQKTDSVIRLVSAVFRLSYLFKSFVEAKMVQFVSPEVVSSMLWFLKHWARVYLLMSEQVNADLSMPFVCAFGRDSEGGAWAVNYLLEQVVTYLMHFNSEPGVTQDTVNLFISLVDCKEKGVHVLKSENLRTLIMIQSNLPQHIKRDLIKGLTLAAVALRDTATRNEYLEQILKPLQTRLLSLVRQENFSKISHEEHIKTEVLAILECMAGVAMGSLPSTLSSIFSYLHPMLYELSNLMRVYRNYQQIVESILTVLNKCVAQLISYLSASDSKKLYEACLQTIQEYAKCNSGRLSLESDSQDDSFADILLLMELLSNMFRKDLVDLSFSSAEPQSEYEQPLQAADVCLYGLNIIMPLVTVDLLKYPALCLQYFNLITYVCESSPEKVCVLPENLLKTLLSSVEMGLSSFVQDVIPYCCNFICALGRYIYSVMAGGEAPHQALKPFLKLLLDLTLSGQLSADFTTHVSSALFVLICCYQDEYRSIVQCILDGQTDPAVRERLAKTFTELTENVSFESERRNEYNFCKKFERFFATVRGFFTVK